MKQTFFNSWIAYYRWIGLIIATLSPTICWGQENYKNAVDELVKQGFENVRLVENEDEYIYTIENNIYKAQGVGIAKAIEVIQSTGLPEKKICKVIVN